MQASNVERLPQVVNSTPGSDLVRSTEQAWVAGGSETDSEARTSGVSENDGKEGERPMGPGAREEVLRAHEAMHESLQHVGKLLEVVTRAMGSCKGFGRHRKEAVEKIIREWQTVVTQDQFLRTRGLPDSVIARTTSAQNKGARKEKGA